MTRICILLFLNSILISAEGKEPLAFSPINFEVIYNPLVEKISDTYSLKSLNPVEPVQLKLSSPLTPISLTEKSLHEISPAEFKQLQADLLYDNGSFELALGLYLDIKESKNGKPEWSVLNKIMELTLKLNLYADFKYWSLKLLDSEKAHRQEILNLIALNIKPHDESFISQIYPNITRYNLKIPDQANLFKILLAHYEAENGKLIAASEWIKKLNPESDYYDKGLILQTILTYRQGRVTLAQNQISQTIDQRHNFMTPLVRNEAYLLAARLHFQMGEYQEAKDFYTKISQDYVEWLPAMIEMGWAQILQGDFEGASGSMFSLHSDFFKNQFIPESYIARTVGYLGLCQYGDALKTVIDLKSRYEPLISSTAEISQQWQAEQYYDFIKDQVNGIPNSDTLPRSWVSWLTRDPIYIHHQSIVNALEDELNTYNTVTMKIIEIEKKALKSQNELLKKERLNDQQSQELEWAKIKIHIAKRSREHVRQLRSDGLARIDKIKKIHRNLAGLALKERLLVTHQNLIASFDKIDILNYEIYHGAGDQIRSVIAGLPIKEREPANQYSNKEKKLKWDFKGEVWKDEIGYFRSSLKNICPQQDGDSL